jgi:hypothetical protein
VAKVTAIQRSPAAVAVTGVFTNEDNYIVCKNMVELRKEK